jgi:predicted TIM-barrel fold metal-dependent hydrolase
LNALDSRKQIAGAQLLVGRRTIFARHDLMCCSRRTVLMGIAGSAATAFARSPRSRSLPPHRIDVHYHPIAPEWMTHKGVAKFMPPQFAAMARAWTPQVALDEMDRNGVELAVCSVSNPGIWFGDAQDARRLARAYNEYAARMKALHPKRFASFAAIPLPDIDGSLKEIAYALDVLGAEGIGLFTSYDGRWLADPAFAEVFAELNRRKATIYVHPTTPQCCSKLVPGLPAAWLEYPMDTTRTMAQWILTKGTARYPDLNLIFSHSGGFLMGGLGRLQILSDTHPEFGMPRSFAHEVAKFYYEISSSADPVTMQSLQSYVPISRIMLGTDSPFIGPMAPNIAQLTHLGLSADDLAAIERGNAMRLLFSKK